MTKKFLKLLSVLSLIALIIPSCVLPSKALSKDASLPAASYAFGNMRFSESLPSINESPAAVRPSSDYRGMKLLVGGMPFGVKFIIHHHYQKKGLFETKIMMRFFIVSLLLAALTLVTLKIQ